MSRPSSLTPEQTAVIKATASVVAKHSLEITKTFYPLMFQRNPEALAFFNVVNQKRGRQPQALANAVAAFGANIDNLAALAIPVDEMAVKHCGLNVLPEHYSIVEDNLMLAISKVLGDAVTPEVAGAWDAAVKMLSQILFTREEQLYQAAERAAGGWRGWTPFQVIAKTSLADDTTLYRFENPAAKGVGIEFDPGQFLTVRCPHGAGHPRHYTIVSKPNQPFLEIAVRLVRTEGYPDGVVSSWLHDDVTVGESVDLSPPFGLFSISNALAHGHDFLFVSAGIGITPVKAMLQQLEGSSTKFASVHQDRSAASHAFAEDTKFARYSSEDTDFAPAGHLSAADLVKAIRESGLDAANTVLVCCGPLSFMEAIASMESELGVATVLCEVFGPQLASPKLHLTETT